MVVITQFLFVVGGFPAQIEIGHFLIVDFLAVNIGFGRGAKADSGAVAFHLKKFDLNGAIIVQEPDLEWAFIDASIVKIS
ncbi:hypothetical protein [Legionella spiritensis]|uniref:hypothetical protein n=1 Tax=Legionella spiritensis TaxID=452 RepID=UPI001E327DD5|nr:hypothetical protein [Legionella spiritensis]